MTNNFSISQNLDAVPDFVPDDMEANQRSEILPLSDLSTPTLPVDCLPDWLAAYCSQLSDAVQAPLETSIMYALPVLSTCLQGKVTISPNGGSHWEPANVWTLVALPPSSRKSPITKAMLLPLEEWEQEQAEKLKPLIDEDEANRAIAKKRITELQNQASKESDRATRKEITQEIAKLRDELDSAPIVAPQLFTGDATNEEFQNLLQRHDGKMSVLTDEGGIFEVMTGLYSNGHANFDVWLQSWSASTLRVNRSGRQTSIASPCASVGITVQPQILTDLGRKRLRGIGLLARFLYAIPRCNIGYRDVRLQKVVDPGVERVYQFNIKRLLDLNPEKPVRLILDDEAREVFYNFAEYIERKQGRGNEFEDFQDWTGKLPGQALRIAALFHTADHWLDKTTVGKEPMEAAVRLCTLLIDHAKAAFSLMGVDPAIDDARYLVEHLKDNQVETASKSELYRLGRFKHGGAVNRLNSALKLLETHGYIEIVKTTNANTTKPTELIMVNPDVLKL